MMAGVMVKLCCTGIAGAYKLLPDCDASIMTVPVLSSVTVLPNNETGPETMAYVIGSPELELALSVNGASVSIRLTSAVKLISFSANDTVKL